MPPLKSAKAAPLSIKRRILNRLRPALSLSNLFFDPLDPAAGEEAAQALFKAREKETEPGTIPRGRFLLRIIERSSPSEYLSAAYFANLEAILAEKTLLDRAGAVVVGLGSGRTGSTTLASLFQGVPGALCTHENPPLIYWTPQPVQTAFHFRRFKMLREYYPVVCDVSHWWLNAIDDFFDAFPTGKAIGLERATKPCADSFMRIKGTGLQSINHWAPRNNAIWSENAWDFTYPCFDVPGDAKAEPDRAKFDMIVRYIEDYNAAMRLRAARRPAHFLLARTETLSEPDQQRRLCEFVEAPFTPFSGKLNEGNVADGEHDEFIF